MSRPTRNVSFAPFLRVSLPANLMAPDRYCRLSGSQSANARLSTVLPAPLSPKMPKISEASRRKLMRSRIGGEPSGSGPTVQLSTSRFSDRSISQTPVDSVARLLQCRPHQVDRRQRDGEEYAGAGCNPPSVDQIFAGVGDDDSETGRRRLHAEAKEAEDRFENHHAGDVEHGDKRDRRQNVRRREQQQNAPVASSQNPQAANIFQTALGHRGTSGDACIERPAGQRQNDDDGRYGRARYPENRDGKNDHRNRQL